MTEYKITMSVASFTDYIVTLGAQDTIEAEQKARKYLRKYHFSAGSDAGITCTRERDTIDVYEIKEVSHKDDLDEDI